MTTVWGVIREGKVELPSELSLADGDRVLVTALSTDDDAAFWMRASESSLDAIWNNSQDDIYAQLLEK